MTTLSNLKVIALAAFMLGCTSAMAAVGAGPYYATPSWDQTLPANTRFVVLTNMNSEAVLDRETGLVWERTPATQERPWILAVASCVQKDIGGRKGWRLPWHHELQSLIDIGSPDGVPVGHPFVGVAGHTFWSATGVATGEVWTLTFDQFANDVVTSTDFFQFERRYMCVRGAQPGRSHPVFP